jgi:hypothetical protein
VLKVITSHVVLCVVAEEFKESEHGKAAVLDLLHLALLLLVFVDVKDAALRDWRAELAHLEVPQESPVVDGPDEEDDLEPAQSRDSVERGDTVGYIRKLEARRNVARKAVNLWHKVAKHGKLADAAMLNLGSAVLIERLLVDLRREASWVEESSGGEYTSLAGVGGLNLRKLRTQRMFEVRHIQREFY